MRNLIYILIIMDEHTFLLQLLREGGGCTVIACYNHTTVNEIACNSTHTDATGTDKIDCFNIFEFHFLLIFNYRAKAFNERA